MDGNGDPIYNSQTHYDYGFRIYNPGIGRFLSVDPLFKEYPWYTPYQFAGNKPIIASDLDGLEEKIEIVKTVHNNKPLVEIKTHLSRETKAALTTTLKTAEYLVGNDTRMGEKAARVNKLFTLANTLVLVDLAENGNTEEKEFALKSLSGIAISEAVALFNPLVGAATSILLQDAIDPEGLTNLDNGRMARAFEQSHDDVLNHPLQIRGRELANSPNANKEVKVFKHEIDFSFKKFASIEVLNDDGEYEEKKFYQNSSSVEDQKMYYFLISDLNEFGAQGHNPTTKVGVEVVPYVKKTEVKKVDRP